VIRSELTVLKEVEHQFIPQGQTIAFVLSESHFCLHTYPEHSYLSIDVYVCDSKFDFTRLMDLLLRAIPQIKHYKHQIVDRGVSQ